MAVYSGFSDYLSIDGVDVSAYIRNVEYNPSMETAETTAGSGVAHRTRNEGLKDSEITVTVVWEITQVPTLIPVMEVGERTFDWGPESNTGGKPRHTQKFIITESPVSGNYEQTDARVFSITGVASEAPTNDMFNGATW